MPGEHPLSSVPLGGQPPSSTVLPTKGEEALGPDREMT